MLFGMPNIVICDEHDENILLEKVFDYIDTYKLELTDTTANTYHKLVITTPRRNFTLMCVPTLFHVASGEREFIMESYGKIRFNTIKAVSYTHLTLPTILLV